MGDFFPPVLFLEGTPFAFTRINLAQVIATVVLIIVLLIGTRRLSVVPTRGQSLIEFFFGFVRDQIAFQVLGERDGKRFLPLLTAMFMGILFMNLTGVIPFINIAGTAVAGVPIMLAVVSYIAFIYAGIKKHGGLKYLKLSLVPSGVPIYLVPIIAVVELISTFIARPVSLFLRLLLNMMVGHMMLVLFFSATHFFLLSMNWFTPLAAGTFALSMAFTLFEIFVYLLQAYVFTILTAVYIQLSVADEH
ncbi:F0F1 ATP synthase subunit A [Microbacterium sp. YY-01]|uniref:F0F1 ATP synthase subunit A n=1 Tax=Microbacterium sp. YY-01 TaxID=3421634 RepID=UPI003D167149